MMRCCNAYEVVCQILRYLTKGDVKVVKDQGTIMKWQLQKPLLHEWTWLDKQYTLLSS